MYYKGKEIYNEEDFCNCKHCVTITSELETLGYWDVCCTCNKPLEYGFHYYTEEDCDEY